MPTKAEWARFYVEKMGWSIIPISPTGKKPIIKSWKEFQKRKPTIEEATEWWEQEPDANIGLLTGWINNISVIDIDEHEITGSIENMCNIYVDKVPNDPSPPWKHCWSSKTANGGVHWFFEYRPELVSKRVIPAVDVKSDGGYVIIPPSSINNRKYKWVKKPWSDVPLPPTKFPPVYFDLFCKNPSIGTFGSGAESPVSTGSTGISQDDVAVSTKPQPNYQRTATFEKGGRDETLFHIANSMLKGGASVDSIRTTIHALANEVCNPPFADAEAKIISALSRSEAKGRSLTKEIKEWVEQTEGIFTSAELDRELLIQTKEDKKHRRTVISRLKTKGIIERANGKEGNYRKVNTNMMPLNYVDVEDDSTYDGFKFPMQIEEWFTLMPKNIVIVGGAPDSGKTAFMLSLADLNQDDFPVSYFSSEMGSLEFKSRLDGFHWRKPSDWNFKAFEREENFADVIDPDGVNIIDFLEIYDNFYQVGQLIKEIWSKLDNGVAIIAIQKNPGHDNPIGGNFARQKARLVINLDRKKCEKTGFYHPYAKITKAKNWKTIINPTGLELEYDLSDGCQFKPRGEWEKRS